MTKTPSTEEITQAVLARPEVARLLEHSHGQDPDAVRGKVLAYLDELRTTQRYPLYRALKHPLYPILRKVERIYERMDLVKAAVAAGRVIYISNHKSHLDYLVEPLALEDHKIRPPVIAAGINLFGGPLGLLHRHIGRPSRFRQPFRRRPRDVGLSKAAQLLGGHPKRQPRPQMHQVFLQARRQRTRQQLQFVIQGEKSPPHNWDRPRNSAPTGAPGCAA